MKQNHRKTTLSPRPLSSQKLQQIILGSSFQRLFSFLVENRLWTDIVSRLSPVFALAAGLYPLFQLYCWSGSIFKRSHRGLVPSSFTRARCSSWHFVGVPQI